MIEDHLWPPGRAAAGHRLPVARHRVVDRFVRHAFGDEIGGQRIRRVPVRLAADHQRRLENIEHGGSLATRQPPGQRRRRRAAFPHRKGGLEKHIAVGQPDGDEIAGLDALGGEGAGAPVGVALELLPGDGIGAVTDCDGVLWFPFGIPAWHVCDRDEHGRFRWRAWMPLLCFRTRRDAAHVCDRHYHQGRLPGSSVVELSGIAVVFAASDQARRHRQGHGHRSFAAAVQRTQQADDRRSHQLRCRCSDALQAPEKSGPRICIRSALLLRLEAQIG